MKDYEALSKAHFDKQAKDYDRKDTYYYSREGKISCRDIADHIENQNYDSLLDVGCGTGYLLEMLAKHMQAQYTGVDLSDQMIRVAKEKDISGATFMTGTADNREFEFPKFIGVCR